MILMGVRWLICNTQGFVRNTVYCAFVPTISCNIIQINWILINLNISCSLKVKLNLLRAWSDECNGCRSGYCCDEIWWFRFYSSCPRLRTRLYDLLCLHVCRCVGACVGVWVSRVLMRERAATGQKLLDRGRGRKCAGPWRVLLFASFVNVPFSWSNRPLRRLRPPASVSRKVSEYRKRPAIMDIVSKLAPTRKNTCPEKFTQVNDFPYV